MAIPPDQQAVAAFLSSLAGTPPVETHISAVFRGADTVWKLKKAVRLSFLDFSGLDARRHFLAREFALNAAAAPGLYQGPRAVVRDTDGRLALVEQPAPGAIILDWVLQMARIPDAAFLDRIAAAGQLTPGLLDELGDVVAAYHQRLAPILHTDPARAMARVIDGNAAAALAAALPTEQVRIWQARAHQACQLLTPWLAARAAGGFIRRGHGDLHLGNLCRWQGRIVPFDALEFDEDLATIDIGYDLAFLLMDLERCVDRAAANRVFNRVLARTGDIGFLRLLPLFLSCRAMIRAHVIARISGARAALPYLAMARDSFRPVPPIMLALGGLPGVGKSTLARALAPMLGGAPGAVILRSDEIRKRLHGVAPETRLPAAAYTAQASARMLHTLTDLARAAAAAGQSVIADATFLDPAHQHMIAGAAHAAAVPFLGIWLDAPMPVLLARIAARVGDASDATADVLRAAATRTIRHDGWISVDATDGAQASRRVQEILRARTEPC